MDILYTFALAFEQTEAAKKRWLWGLKERVLWKDYIDREVVQEAFTYYRYVWMGNKNEPSSLVFVQALNRLQ